MSLSSGTKKPSPSKSVNLRTATMPNPPRSPLSRGSSSSTVTANGVARAPSTRGSAGVSRPVKRPSPGNSSFLNTNVNVSDDTSEEDARAESISIMDELKSQVRKAETASEEYQRQLNMLQTRLDDSLLYQAKLEDQTAECMGKMEELENEIITESRQRREMENSFDAERAAFSRDKGEQKVKEAELESTIQRLKESLAQRELRSNLDEDGGFSRSRKFGYLTHVEFKFLTFLQRLSGAGHLQISQMTSSLRHQPFLVLTRRAIQICLCKKIRLLRPCGLNWPNSRSKTWSWRIWVVEVECMNWRKPFWKPALQMPG